MSQNQKRLQWEMIKSESPDVAVLLEELSTVFGKPGALRVELESGEFVESGEFEPDRIVFDGKARVRYGKR